MSKHRLLLSAAAIALLSGPVLAADCPTGVDGTCITSKRTSVATTSELGNITIYEGGINADDDDNDYEGSIKVNEADTAAVTINSDNYVNVNGIIANTKSSGAVGLLVDLSSDRDVSALSFDNYGEDTLEGVAFYLDQSAVLNLSDSGTGKTGILLQGSGTLTGDILTASGSSFTVKGDESTGVLVASGATLNGDLTLGGSLTMYQSTTNEKVFSDMVGIELNGSVVGDVRIGGGSTVTVVGHGSRGIVVGGSGIDGNLTIEGALSTIGVDASSLSTSSSSYYSSSSNRTYADGGQALVVNSSISHGLQITGARFNGDSSSSTGSVTSYGVDEAILIEANSATPVVIGIYESREIDDDTDQYTNDTYTAESYNPGFGFYNRGSVSISSYNKVKKDGYEDVTAILISGGDSAVVIEGGIYNSGSVSAALVSKYESSVADATAIKFEDDVYISGYSDYTLDVYTYRCDVSAGNGIPDCTLTSDGRADKGDSDQAALVNSNDTGSGTISASVSGNGGGTATALWIGEGAHLSSLINTGTISASASTNYTDIVSTLAAYAIKDESGTLTYIYNSGTIAAAATTLDDDSQIARAIDLTAGNADNIIIVNEATSTSSAAITGDIYLGDGDNQQIYVSGAGSSYTATITGDIHYGSGSDNILSIGAFGYVNGQVTTTGSVNVNIYNNGILYLTNAESALYADDFSVADGGYLAIGLSENASDELKTKGSILASGTVSIESGANMGVSYNSYISTGDATGSYTATDYNGADYVLISANPGSITVDDLQEYSSTIARPMSDEGGALPYLFKSASLSLRYVDADGNVTTDATAAAYEQMVLHVEMKSADDMGLTGYAKTMFPYVNVALTQDDLLGAAMISGIHADAGDLTATGTSQQAQAAYNAYAPDVTGGTRAIAIGITDQATGVVAARQRSLRMYARTSGEMTLWGQEFVQMIKVPGQGKQQVDKSYEKNGFKDHGFGFVLGLDAGSPKDGWYGGAITFYNGDVNETGRTAHENQLWVLATGYSTWRGKGFFLDAKLDAGYGHIKGTRYIYLKTGTGSSEAAYIRTAQNSHSALLISGGLTGGGTFTYDALTFMPQISLDALMLREDGYTEENPSKTNTTGTGLYGDAFSLRVKPYFSKSLRAFVGTSVRYDIDLWGVYLQPELRLGYRYDFLADPVKVKAAFRDIDATTAGGQIGEWFSLTGPTPASGSFVAGTSLGATTRDWSVNLHFDFVKGEDGTLQEVGTVNLVGRL